MYVQVNRVELNQSRKNWLFDRRFWRVGQLPPHVQKIKRRLATRHSVWPAGQPSPEVAETLATRRMGVAGQSTVICSTRGRCWQQLSDYTYICSTGFPFQRLYGAFYWSCKKKKNINTEGPRLTWFLSSEKYINSKSWKQKKLHIVHFCTHILKVLFWLHN